ncbi:aldose 1-epimerase family protein [Microbacterium sp. MPKO10]|uniref:aldose 1-epimerase family protein n=1 Tax=Microbacterium sp. MPKO10 TaxID=2989818 RepID=UPI002235C2FD|nr:aldose 1-epimerase family protein [Microbacterium sp. MPKO10]MCW4456762.1 aldose 1-epimerase family protein [Microbacterium sp. MPKO10]
MTRALSGRQITLRHGDYSASIASIGASLRALQYAGRDLVVPFDADDVRPAYRGATLVPWPNRVVDGRYAWRGAEHQLALTEPARGHALHGLGAWLDYGIVEQTDDAVTLGAAIPAQDGYPFALDVAVAFRLDADGLHTAVTATNRGDQAAPFGTGPHPYLVAGEGRVDDWAATIPAENVLTVTEDRLIPTGLEPVEGTRFDFRFAHAIGDTFIDHAYTQLARDAEGIAAVQLRSPSGTGVEMTWDDACPWVQVHTADRDDAPEISRIGLAVEPMTCPPDAFNSGTDLITLDPDASATASWSIRAL